MKKKFMDALGDWAHVITDPLIMLELGIGIGAIFVAAMIAIMSAVIQPKKSSLDARYTSSVYNTENRYTGPTIGEDEFAPEPPVDLEAWRQEDNSSEVAEDGSSIVDWVKPPREEPTFIDDTNPYWWVGPIRWGEPSPLPEIPYQPPQDGVGAINFGDPGWPR